MEIFLTVGARTETRRRRIQRGFTEVSMWPLCRVLYCEFRPAAFTLSAEPERKKKREKKNRKKTSISWYSWFFGAMTEEREKKKKEKKPAIIKRH